MTNQYFLGLIGNRNPSLRAADADREAIGERLRKSHTEGRLDLTEFQQRLERCYAAKTFGELDELVQDLPRESDERPSPSWFTMPAWRFPRLVSILIVLIVLVAASGHHVFWLWIPVVFVIWRMSWWRRRWHMGSRGRPDGWL
jgi:hypothetical protein